jgi:hypothetical protein
MSYEVWGEPDEIPECQSCEEAAKDYEELEKVVDDLAQLVKQLARALRNTNPDAELPAKALDYLKRKELLGSPLREVSNA